jgi:crotonobetainyl-CoA:carnitine CoA-transferase CaiB-like acyl-CoA transferase
MVNETAVRPMALKQREFAPDARPPLADLRVVDFSRLVAGNMLSLQLADFGAEIIKIEDPAQGDPLRAWRTAGFSLHWKVYARNKKSVALSLRDPDGIALARKLVATADVMIENFRPGTLEEMGLAPDVLLSDNPKLILVRISGFGQDGPYRERPGFGSLVEGMSGFAAMNGYADRAPVLPPLALADMIAGLYGAYAVMIARREVERSGRGQVIDLPLLDPIISILGPQAALYRATGKLPARSGSRSQTTSPRNVFRTRDGRWIAISASIQTMAARLFRAVGRPEMIDDPRFATNAARVRNAEECERPIADFIGARDFQEVMATFEREEITAAPVYDVDQLLDDPHVIAREIFSELPDADTGRIPMHAVVPRLSDTPGAIRAPAPALGEHTRELLAPLAGDRFEELAARGTIRL